MVSGVARALSLVARAVSWVSLITLKDGLITLIGRKGEKFKRSLQNGGCGPVASSV